MIRIILKRHIIRAGFLLATIIPVAVGVAAPAPPPPSPPNVLLVIFDALRYDRLGHNGYGRPITPGLDRFANSAVRYRNAIASAPTTLPSHASMFTGLPVFMHGARNMGLDEAKHNVNPLHHDYLTLAEFLSERGYATAAFFANAAFLSKYWQLDQGFQTYVTDRVWSDKLNPTILAWLDQPRKQPFFVCVNYIDTHRPYNVTPVPGLPFRIPSDDNVELIEALEERVMGTDQPLPKELLAKLTDQYDAAVANVDRHFLTLVGELKKRDLYDNTVILVTADHGEFFGEHRLIGHGKDVYEEVIRVPLLIKAPGQTAGREDPTPVAGMDIPYLILSHLPNPILSEGTKSFPFRPGNHPFISEKYYGGKDLIFDERFGKRLNRIRIAVIDAPWKLIHSSDGKHELYNLDQDPREQKDIHSAHPKESKRLENQLRSFIKKHGITLKKTPHKSPLGEEDLKNLKALGYIQ